MFDKRDPIMTYPFAKINIKANLETKLVYQETKTRKHYKFQNMVNHSLTKDILIRVEPKNNKIR